MNKKLTLKQKLKNKFSFLCTSKVVQASPPKPQKQQKQEKKKPIIIQKNNRRQTLNLQNAFLKISRKNVVEEEFITNDMLTLQLQKYINRRLKGSDIVLVKGQFSPDATKSVPFIINMSQYQCKNEVSGEKELISTKKLINIRDNTIDAVLYQTQESMPGKMGKRMDEICEIDQLLRKYHSQINNMILICSSSLCTEEFSTLLEVYAQFYLYQLQKIKQNQKLMGYVVYVSSGPQFLKLNQNYFEVFISETLGNFSNKKISELISKLIKENFHKEIINTIRLLKRQEIHEEQFYECFIETIAKRYPQTQKITQGFTFQQKEKGQKMYRETPLFGYGHEDMTNDSDLLRMNSKGDYEVSFF